MKLLFTEKPIEKLEADAVAVGVFKGGRREALKGLSSILSNMNFKGKVGESVTIPWRGSYKNVIAVGLGEKGKLNEDRIRTAASKAVEEAKKLNAKRLVSQLFGEEKLKGRAAKAVAEGFLIGNYEFNRYRKERRKGVEEVLVSGSGNYRDSFELGKLLSEATNYTRDIVNEPGNVINPITLSEIACRLSEELGLECRVFDEKELEKEKMVGILSVGRGSKTPPRFVHIAYRPEGAERRVVIVGKGVTFDSGGLNVKPEQYMRKMKSDKAGACAVLGILMAVSRMKLNVEVHGLMPLAENMPDGKSFRPDDILTFRNGKSVEIHSTDAEGRLILADALIYGSELEPDLMVDMATLTGACVVALGNYTSGVFTEDEELSNSILRVSERTGEKMWRLPLDEDLEEDIKGNFSDLQNVGKTRYGGAITAALFLKSFVGKSVKSWAHIDIAGPAFLDKRWKYYSPGATGQPVRTMVELIKGLK